MKDSKKYLAELLGTFALVFIGCGSAVIAGKQIGFLGISFAFGLTVLAMVYAIGSISGCHINPAITISMFVGGKINLKDAAGYIISQCVGAVLASSILLVIASGLSGYSLLANGLGQNGYGIHSPMGYSLSACFWAEVVLTAIFLFVIFGSTSKDAPKGFAGISIGLSLVLIHLLGIPITGTSVNPARSLGPALLVGGDALGQLWLFWVAPIIGGIISALIWRYMLEPE
ncbi:MAG: aquaporin Z [Syntrophobacteraceae bacterium CG23_combo_of_CG06-09_8_20_14_all_50_8]|nr:MAG: aquaporin Z [Syntrophobacteraceae bacterium CG23_combo_of_CG06-09_8_20_14_all_50_8]